MALTPTLSVSINISSEEITFTDTTGRYDGTNNTGGWGTPNADYATSGDVTAAKILVYDYNDTLLETFTVTTELNAASGANESVIFSAEDWTHGDGVYKYDYQLDLGNSFDDPSTDPVEASTGKTPFLHRGNLLQCIDDQRFKYLQEADEKKRTKYKHRVDELMMIDTGLVNTFQVGNYADANSGYSDASDLCGAYDNCEC